MSSNVSADVVKSSTSGQTGDNNVGRGPHSRGGRGGRRQGYQGRGGRNGSRGPSTTVTFKGDTADMNGHVYQTFNENDDKRQFGKTTEALGRWINMHT